MRAGATVPGRRVVDLIDARRGLRQAPLQGEGLSRSDGKDRVLDGRTEGSRLGHTRDPSGVKLGEGRTYDRGDLGYVINR
jgi:hypothetical protein